MVNKRLPSTTLGVKRFVKKECKVLAKGDRSFASLYDVLFCRQMVMAETNDGTKIQSYTYAWAKEQVECVAKGISKLIGKTDCFIALYGKNSVEWLVLFWAILRSGNKPYLVNSMQPESFIQSILHTLKVEFVVCKETAPNYEKQVLCYQELFAVGSEAPQLDQSIFGNEIAITTSGTTLKEKICVYTGREITAQILNANQAFDWNIGIGRVYKGRLKMFAMLPFYHIFGLEASYLWLTFVGATMVFTEDMVPETLLRTIRMHEVTHIFAVPLFWNTVEKKVRHEIAKQDKETRNQFEQGLKSSLKLQNIWPWFGRMAAKKLFATVREKTFGDSISFCISGGSPIKPSTLELFNGLGYELLNGYGMSEIGIAAANFSKKPKDKIEGASVGFPFSSATFKVDEAGRLFVRGDSVCKKMIIDQQPATSEEWFDTGDIVCVDASGKYYIQGRASDVVLGENGENLNPDLAEGFFELPGAKSFCVLGDTNNEMLMLVVQLPQDVNRDYKEILLRDIAACEKKLPEAYAIKQIWFTQDALMEDADIKISRAKVKRV